MLLLLLELMAGCTYSHAKDPVCPEKVDTLCAPCAACPPPIPATVPPVEPPLVGAHTIAFYVQTALNRNPEILAAQRQVTVQAEMAPQVSTLPYPTLTGIVWPWPSQTVQTAAGRIINTMILQQARAGLTTTVKLDLMRGEVELVKLQEQRINLHQKLMQAQADLAKLLSTSPDTNLSAADALDLPAVPDQLDLLYQAALISRPELQGNWMRSPVMSVWWR